MAKNESKTLNESFENNISPDIQANLENLKGLGIDPTLFAQFESRIKEIIGENPESEDVVIGEIQRTALWVENLFAGYHRQFRSAVNAAANDDDISLAA